MTQSARPATSAASPEHVSPAGKLIACMCHAQIPIAVLGYFQSSRCQLSALRLIGAPVKNLGLTLALTLPVCALRRSLGKHDLLLAQAPLASRRAPRSSCAAQIFALCSAAPWSTSALATR